MSRDLGVVQRRALEIIGDRREDLLTTDLSTLLCLTPRRSRSVVASLVDRGLVVVTHEGRERRAWLPHLRRQWVSDREYVRFLLASLRRDERTCLTCGGRVQRDAFGRWRAV